MADGLLVFGSLLTSPPLWYLNITAAAGEYTGAAARSTHGDAS
jgi:hypothetical protein